MSKVTLDFPIIRKHKDGSIIEEIKEIVVRKPVTGELLGLGVSVAQIMNSNMDAIAAILPIVCSPLISESEVKSLDLGDFTSLANEVTGFFYNSQMKAALGILTK